MKVLSFLHFWSIPFSIGFFPSNSAVLIPNLAITDLCCFELNNNHEYLNTNIKFDKKNSSIIYDYVKLKISQIDTVENNPSKELELYEIYYPNQFDGKTIYFGKNHKLLREIYALYDTTLKHDNWMFFDTLNREYSSDYVGGSKQMLRFWTNCSFDLIPSNLLVLKDMLFSCLEWLELLKFHGIERLREQSISPLFKTTVRIKIDKNYELKKFDYEYHNSIIYDKKFMHKNSCAIFQYYETICVGDTVDFIFNDQLRIQEKTTNINLLNHFKIIDSVKVINNDQFKNYSTVYRALAISEGTDSIQVIRRNRVVRNNSLYIDENTERLWFLITRSVTDPYFCR